MKKNLEKLPVVIFLNSLEMGGAQRQAFLLAEYLRGHEKAAVQVWAFSIQGMAAESFRSLAIPLVEAPSLNGNAVKKTIALAALTLRLRRIKPKIIVPFCDFPNKVCGAIWPLTGADMCVWNQRDEGREITGKFLERRALRNVETFVANSQEGASFLIRAFGVNRNRIAIIANGVRLAQAELSGRQWREKLAIGADAFVAVMTANLTAFKDHMTLLRAWRLVLNRAGTGKRPLLLLAGKPVSTETRIRDFVAEAAMADSVKLIGQVRDVAGLLQACDLGIFSSKFEGMPNSVLEYLAAGLPVVATDIVGIREALGDDYPFLVAPEDPQMLADKILVLTHDEHARRENAAQNYLRAENFSPAVMGEKYCRLFAQPLGIP